MQRFERKRAAPGVVLEIWLRPRLGVTRTGIGVHSAATPVAGFFRALSITGSLIRRWIGAPCPGHSCDATGSQGRRGGVVSGQQSGKYRKGSTLTFSNLREVIMTMSEYEERFRRPAPSLHQTFAEVRRPNRGGRRSRRLWVTAALVGVMTITSKAALHHSSHADGSQVSKSGIQACDFIYR